MSFAALAMRSTRAAAKPCCENSSIAAARIAARVREDLSYSRRRGLPFARLRLRPLNTLSPAVFLTSTRGGGGVREIRTLDTGLSRYNALAGRPLRPLGHHSGRKRILLP